MKKLSLTLLFTFVYFLSFGQILEPASWSYQISDTDFKKGDVVELTFNVKLDSTWHLYTIDLDPEIGPLPTEFEFEADPSYELLGEMEQIGVHEEYDKTWEAEVSYFSDIAVFNQKIKILSEKVNLKGSYFFLVCTTVDGMCIPGDGTFALSDFLATSVKEDTKTSSVEKERKATVSEEEYYGIASIETNATADCEAGANTLDSEEKTISTIFLLGLIGGILALFTPCVFPLIPLTVSFFTKDAETKWGMRNAVLYGFFIFLVYVLLSVPFHMLDSINPDILNDISTNVWLNVLFFVIFIVFAFSFFGYYEINMPHSLTNKVSAAEEAGGIIGVFFMALTLSLVSFSCTGPILGSLLAGALSSDGGAWQLTAGMSGFGLALALPFTLFAMFPGWMNKIPKSGGWLNTVKVVLGFAELALAFKFLSNADLVMHWGLIRYEVFMVVWIIVGLATSAYVFGLFRFPHDSKIEKLAVGRIATGVVFSVISIYLIFGLTKNEETNGFNSLKLLSGLAPPAGYSWIYPNDCPNGINCFKDLQSGLAYAKKANKPVLLDFTGYACVNCRKMEEHVWSDKRVFNLINDEYVLISLYVDDKKSLPKTEQVEVERIGGGTRLLKNYGHKWAHFQTKFFESNSQPFYALVSSDGSSLLTDPVGYIPSIEEYARFLECGLSSNVSFLQGTGQDLVSTK
ncbi:MAG: thioredoxin family protein [Cyclobacteriaceae bacterium]